jgi:hypothetical protein
METDRDVLNAAPTKGEEPETNLAEAIRCRFLPLGAVDQLNPIRRCPLEILRYLIRDAMVYRLPFRAYGFTFSRSVRRIGTPGRPKPSRSAFTR